MAKNNFRMPGGMGNMGNLMAQAQKMQREMEETKHEIDALRIEGTAGGGQVKLTLGGDHKLYSISIEKDVIDPEDPEMLQDLIMAAFNQANDTLTSKSEEMMAKVTGGVKLPF